MDNKATYRSKQLMYDRLLKVSLIITPVLIITVIFLLVMKKYSLLMIILTVLFLILMTLSVHFAINLKSTT